MNCFTRSLVLTTMGIMTTAGFLIVSGTIAAAKDGSREPEAVSIIALIASPRQYKDAQVWVAGYLHLAYEADSLFFHEEDCRHGLSKNGLRLILSRAQETQFKGLSGKYVLIEGTFDDSPSDMFSGYIKNVITIRELLTEEEFLRRQSKSAD
jgi:hypothetical protein